MIDFQNKEAAQHMEVSIMLPLLAQFFVKIFQVSI